VQSILPKILLVSIQLLAITLLQMPMFLPLVEKVVTFHPRGTNCYQDHQLCGCSPERIANNTCCCSKTAVSSRMAADHNEEDSMVSCCTHEQRSKTSHSLTMAPCGSKSPLFMASVQDCLHRQYVGKIKSPSMGKNPFFEYPENLQTRYSDPPDRPPNILFSV